MSAISDKHLIEAALLTSEEPLSVADLRTCLDGRLTKGQIQTLLVELQMDWSERALELKCVAEGLWRFQSKREVRDALAKLHPQQAPKYTRSVMETLAVIAYRQPVTRADIERIRGVTVNPQAIRTLMEREWIEVVGRRETVGHPELLATTKRFLSDLGINSIAELPVPDADTLPERAEFALFNATDDERELENAGTPRALLEAIDREHTQLESLTLPLETQDENIKGQNE